MPQLVDLVEDNNVMFVYPYVFCEVYSFKYHFLVKLTFCFSQDIEELMNLPPEKVLLKWMNFHLKKAGYKKTVTNFSSDVKVYAPCIPSICIDAA